MEQIIMNDKEVKRKIIMTCIEMFIARGLIDISNKQTAYEELLSSESDNVYKIKIYPPIKNEEELKEKEIKYKHYAIKLFREKLTAISKTSGMVDFLKEHKDYYKILILKDAGQKVINQIVEYENTQLLYEEEMLTNPLDYESQPKFEPFDMNNREEMNKFFKEYYCNKAQLEKMDDNNPVARFLDLKVGQAIRIIRPSEVSGESVAYRIVVKHIQIKK
jgi:DNA-directed RNA polymerase subunit H (RpoH/RPB5)